MISGITKKAIFFSFLFINFIQPSKSAEFSKINENFNKRNIKTTLSNVHNLDIPPNSQSYLLSNDFDDGNNFVKILHIHYLHQDYY